jgi:hypothetical protein
MEARQQLRGARSQVALLVALVVAMVAALLLAGFGGYALRGPQSAVGTHSSFTVETPPSDPACKRYGGPGC